MIETHSFKSVTLVINPITFVELQMRADQKRTNLSDLYVEAVSQYIDDCMPDRLKVFAAPGSGKRIKILLSKDDYFALSQKIGSSGFNINDVIYTALECFLDETLTSRAA